MGTNLGKMQEYTDYMGGIGVHRKLQKKVRRFFGSVHTVDRIFEEKTMLARLPLGLRIDMVAERILPTLQACPFVPDAENNTSCIEAVIQRVMARTALTGDRIINEGAVGGELYFIMSGQVWAYVAKNQERKVSVLSDHDYFGEIAVMLGGRRRATCIAARCLPPALP